MELTIMHGNTLNILPKIDDNSIDLCLTSPPYWGLRNYENGENELGAEESMELYIENTMLWVKEIYRILKPTGSFVLNIGDCFIGGGRGSEKTRAIGGTRALGKGQAPPPNWSALKKNGTADWKANTNPTSVNPILGGIYKTKQLLSVSSFIYCHIISETDFVCRGEHIWAKPNVPSPIRIRLKHSHEKLFWFVKDADKYYFENKAWMKKVKESSNMRYENPTGRDSPHCENIGLSPSSCFRSGKGQDYLKNSETIEHSWRIIPVGAKQSGFELEGKQASEHIAPYPENLIRPYIQSLCPHDGVIMDPFLGSGTTMRVAMEEGRNAIGIELNKNYIEYTKKRLNWGQGLDCQYKLYV
jgi:site-specific DNA-methyltransferase (adenine-specific)